MIASERRLSDRRRGPTVNLSRHQTDPLVRGASFTTVMMWMSAVAICLVGAVGLYTTIF